MRGVDFIESKMERVPVKRKSFVGLVGKFFLTSVSMGVILAGMLVPPTIVAAHAMKAPGQAWEAIDADVSSFDNVVAPRQVRLLDANGNAFAQFYSESRIPLTFEQIGQNAIDAIVATEDADFWAHEGLSHRGIARAALSTLSGRQKQGASTLTMQLVQNLRQVKASYDSDEDAWAIAQANTPALKLQEMKMALEYEKKHTKQEILTAYFNVVYFGHGFYGLGAASQGYFSKKPSDLTIPEASMIAGLAQNPSAFDPIENPDGARERRNQVLSRLRLVGKITSEQEEEFAKLDLGLNVNQNPVGSRGCAPSKYPHFCELVKAELLNHPLLGGTEVERKGKFYAGGFDVKTTLSPQIADGMEEAAKAFDSDPYQTGIAEVEPSTGAIRGVAQSTTFDESQNVLANSALQVGSTFKPITIASAIDNGVSVDWQFNVSDGYYSGVFENPPGGFGNSAYTVGTMGVDRAVRTSNNVWFVKLLEKVGVQETADVARRLGLTIPALHGSEGSLTLGSYEATPIELASVYATFANSGIRCQPHTISAIGDKTVQPDCRRAISAEASAKVNELLKQPLYAGGTAESLRFNSDVRVKSGSTDYYSVLWLAAYTPKGAMAGWVADPKGPTANPVRNVDVYGSWKAVGYGGEVAGKIVERAFNNSGIESARFVVNGGGSIVQSIDPTFEVRGLSPEVAVTLIAPKEKVTIKNVDGAHRTSESYADGILTVTGAPELDGNTYYFDKNSGQIIVEGVKG